MDATEHMRKDNELPATTRITPMAISLNLKLWMYFTARKPW